MNEKERTRLLLFEQTKLPMSYSLYRSLNSAASVVTFLEIDAVLQEPATSKLSTISARLILHYELEPMDLHHSAFQIPKTKLSRED